MDVFAPNAAQRRFLVEMLAAELDEEGPLWVGEHDRRAVMEQLASQGLVVHIDAWALGLTEHGRSLAERFADHMLGLSLQLEGCA